MTLVSSFWHEKIQTSLDTQDQKILMKKMALNIVDSRTMKAHEDTYLITFDIGL